MSEPMFTPGPWGFSTGLNSFSILKTHMSESFAAVWRCRDDPKREAEQLANTILMIHTPELYAMVDELTHFVEDIPGTCVTDLEQHYSLIERANGLLAKARGEHDR